MTKFILEDELRDAVTTSSFIKNGSLESCEGMKYDFRVSSRLLSPRFNRDRVFDEKDESSFVIKPGETAYVVTEEELNLPSNVFCQLSTKRKLSHDGILVLGGFSVDPNYNGRLFFGMHNLSNEDYPFLPGKKIIAGIFYKLSDEEAEVITSIPEPLYDFPDALIKNVKFFRSTSAEALEAKIEELKTSLSTIKDQIDSDKTWKEEFKRGLSENNDQIGKLGLSLDKLAEKLGQEIDERKQGEAALDVKYSVVNGIGKVLGFIFGGAVAALLALLLAGILKF